MSNSSQYVEQKIDFAKWFFSVFSWDGLLPLVVLFVPYLIGFIPNINQDMEEFLLVNLVITIFLIRFFIGRKKISENSCGHVTQKSQQILFSIGVFYILFIDAFACTIVLFAQRAGGANNQDFNLLMMLVIPYLLLMTIAMYPGKTVRAYEEKDVLDKSWEE